MQIKSREDALKVLDELHSKGVRTVIITSADFGESDSLSLIGSQQKTDNKTCTRFEIKFPKMEGRFTGTGDLFAALVTAFQGLDYHSLEQTCERVISIMQAVLRRTCDFAQSVHVAEDDVVSKVRRFELQLIQSRDDILEPKLTCHAVSIN